MYMPVWLVFVPQNLNPSDKLLHNINRTSEIFPFRWAYRCIVLPRSQRAKNCFEFATELLIFITELFRSVFFLFMQFFGGRLTSLSRIT